MFRQGKAVRWGVHAFYLSDISHGQSESIVQRTLVSSGVLSANVAGALRLSEQADGVPDRQRKSRAGVP